jgi:hypothetical protein|tara:strand:- start:14159 stop:14296 length:138 start_codon:yes stop_codon:yes gene_type:complete
VDGDKPLYEAFLRTWRRFAFALTERPNHGNNNITGYALGGIQILD